MILVVGVPGAQKDVMLGTQTCSGSGDSGGPLFINSSTLVGITHGGGLQKHVDANGRVSWTCGSYYSDLSRPENIDFLESVLKCKIKVEDDSDFPQ